MPSSCSSSSESLLAGVSIRSLRWLSNIALFSLIFWMCCFSSSILLRVASLLLSMSCSLLFSAMHFFRYASSCEGARGACFEGTASTAGAAGESLEPSMLMGRSCDDEGVLLRNARKEGDCRKGIIVDTRRVGPQAGVELYCTEQKAKACPNHGKGRSACGDLWLSHAFAKGKQPRRLRPMHSECHHGSVSFTFYRHTAQDRSVTLRMLDFYYLAIQHNPSSSTPQERTAARPSASSPPYCHRPS